MYVKVKALGLRPEGCQARTATLARYLGVATATAGRGLTALSRPAGDGVVELRTERRTLPGGRGLSALRTTRPLRRNEPYVWLPVAAAEDLTARQLRAYALIAYAQVRGALLTESQLAGSLRHHSGRRAGMPLSTTAAGLIVDALAVSRWVTVDRRAEARGCHRLIAHDLVARLAPSSEADQDLSSGTALGILEQEDSSQAGEQSGSQAGEQSLANRESPRTDSLENERAAPSSAVGEVPVVTEARPGENRDELMSASVLGSGGLALRADGTKSAPAEVDTHPRRSLAENTGRYTGPQLSLSAQVYGVLEPVHWLLAKVDNVFVSRQIAREVGRQLRDGTLPERLHHRLTVRLRGTMIEEIRDPGRWILGAALPRWGCGLHDCESGVLWMTGTACEVCAEALHTKRVARQREQRREQGLCPEHGTRPGPSGECIDCHLDRATGGVPDPVMVPRPKDHTPRADCAGCGARIVLTGHLLDDGLCKPCRTMLAPPAAPAPEKLPTCSGHDGGTPCTRTAVPTRTVCVRHLAAELASV
ncbi:hypothetical protein [Streptomyces finlayi]|uniref:hypothetical protein n=1 Tax=Streptomyces finlayi TaxID=67296 RepID=UPI001E296A8F|nr:hypothetical protein [Streptomyces finlayi]